MRIYSTSVGRRYTEDIDILVEDSFLNDYTKILQSKAFRRLAYKTQVHSMPDNPHVRTRLVHTNEVIAVSIYIAEQLGLNKNLCMAIAAGHDIGHTPYGHDGERVLSKFSGKSLKHYINSVVVAQHVERKGRGLNLTHETLEGMINHSRGDGKLTVDDSLPLEYAVVMFADKIAYTFSDLNDAIRYGYLDEKCLPDFAIGLGGNQRQRTTTVVDALVRESKRKNFVSFNEGKVFENFNNLKSFMFQEVYSKKDFSIQNTILLRLCEFFQRQFKDKEEFAGVPPEFAVSLLTDREANYYGELLLCSRNPSEQQISNFGVWEILPHLRGKTIDYTNPDLDWAQKPDNLVKQP